MSHLDRALLGLIVIYVVVTSAIPYLYGTYLALPLVLAAALMVVTRRVSGAALGWTIALASVGVVGSVVGFVLANPGTRSALTIYVVEPVIFGIFLGSMSRIRGWRTGVVAALDWALLASVALGIALYVAASAGGTLPGWLVDPAYTAVDTSTRVLRTNFQGFNSLVFLVPWGLARFCWKPAGERRSWTVLLALAALAGVGLAGRRILYVIVPVIGILALVVYLVAAWPELRSRPRERAVKGLKMLLGIVSLVAVSLAFTAVVSGVGVSGSVGRIHGQVSNTAGNLTGTGTPIQPGDVEGSDVRIEESSKMLGFWAESPLWGHGSGAVVPDYTRSESDPWIYELTYHMLLVDFGLLGGAVLALWALWTTWWLLRGVRSMDGLSMAMLCGWGGALLASITDPYLLKVDGMWMVFLPFGLAVAVREHRWAGQPDRLEQRTHALDGAGPRRLLVLLVAYHNLADVQRFVGELRQKAPEVDVAVCDNSEDANGAVLEMPCIDASVERPDNPGYLDGGIAALEAYRAAHPDRAVGWVMLSNTDLEILSDSLVQSLDAHDSHEPLMIAPRITEGPQRWEKNPHVVRPRSSQRLWINSLATGGVLRAYAYLVLSMGRQARSSKGDLPRELAPAGSTMFSPYGAVLIWSAGLVERYGLTDRVPLLAEEYAVAEVARRAGASVRFDPSLHFLHDPHTTTGPKVSLRRARMLSRAFTWIDTVARTG